jgi:hypothetical protein
MPNWDGNQPIVKFLKRWIPICIPQVTVVGGFNRRPTETGGFSAHSEGRAADIHLDAFDPIHLQIGDALVQMFIDYATDLGVDHIIWNREIWSADRAQEGLRTWPPDRNPHTNHVHVAFTRQGSQAAPPYIIALLDGVYIEVFGTIAGIS